MKEADIVFGELYAIEIENVLHCRRVCRKVPPDPGKKRSRTYVIDVRDSDGSSAFPDTIDASKIVMLWRDYEKTPEYAAKHLEELEGSLDNRVRMAITQWWQTLIQYLDALADANLSNYVPYMIGASSSVEELEKAVGSHSCSISIKRLTQLADIPLPPTDDVEAAMNMREEVLRDMRRSMLPAAAAKLTASFGVNSVGERTWDMEAMGAYVDLVRQVQEPGPHEPLVLAAKNIPNAYMLKSLTEEPQFHYLIQHLDFS